MHTVCQIAYAMSKGRITARGLFDQRLTLRKAIVMRAVRFPGRMVGNPEHTLPGAGLARKIAITCLTTGTVAKLPDFASYRQTCQARRACACQLDLLSRRSDPGVSFKKSCRDRAAILCLARPAGGVLGTPFGFARRAGFRLLRSTKHMSGRSQAPVPFSPALGTTEVTPFPIGKRESTVAWRSLPTALGANSARAERRLLAFLSSAESGV